MTEFVLAENGIIRRDVTERVVSNADALLENMAAAAKTNVPNAFTVKLPPTEETANVLLAVNRTHQIAQVRLPRFSLKTTFALTDGHFVPTFKARNQAGTDVFCELTWVPPPATQMFFSLEAIRNGYGRYVPNAFCLFATIAGEAGFFQLPLPNQFRDGRLCLGDVDHVMSLTIQGLMATMLEILEKSLWNSDQRPNMVNAQKLFRFDPATNKPVAPTVPLASVCAKINHPIMMEM